MQTPIDHFIHGNKPLVMGRPYGSRTLSNVPLDFTKTYRELGEEFGVDPMIVRAEFKLRHPNVRKHHAIIPPAEKESWQKFKAWDWTKKDVDLAVDHGLCRERIRQIRKGLGLPPSRSGLSPEQWAEIDWSATNEELAEGLGMAVGTIKIMRRKLAPGTGYRFQRNLERIRTCEAITPEEWRTLTQDEILARMKEINPEASAKSWLDQWKKEHPEFHKPSRWNSAERYARIDWKKMTLPEIAEIVGVSAEAVRAWGQSHGFVAMKQPRGPSFRESNKYANADWTKSNAELAEHYGITSRSMSNVRTRLAPKRKP